MMTVPWSMPSLSGRAGLVARFGRDRHQGDQHRPRDEDVGVEHRQPEYGVRHVEQREHRVVEQQRAEHAERHQALPFEVEAAHPTSLPSTLQSSGRTRTTVTFHGVSAITCPHIPRVGARLHGATIRIWSTSVIVASLDERRSDSSTRTVSGMPERRARRPAADRGFDHAAAEYAPPDDEKITHRYASRRSWHVACTTRGVTMNREAVVSVFARARRIVAAAVCAAALPAGAAGAQAAAGAAERIDQMSAAQAREFTIVQIKAMVAMSRAGSRHGDAQCRAAAARAGTLAGNAIEGVVQADQSRDRGLRTVGTQAAEDPAVMANYQRVAAATLEARQSVMKGMNCPDLLAERP